MTRAFFCAALTLAAVAGCSTVSDMYGRVFGGSEGPKPTPLVQFKPSASARVVWQASIGGAGDAAFTPAYDQGSVYVASRAGALARLDAATGRQMWRIDAHRRLSGGVGAGENRVLVGTDKGEVLAFDESGKALWTAQVSTEVLAPPKIADGMVVVRAADGRIFGLDAASGERKWIYQRATPALTVRSYAGVTVARGAVFAGFAGGKLVALNLANGVVGWEATVAQPRGTTELERIADVTSPAVVGEREVCAAAFQGRVACFEIASGNLLWARDVSSYAGLALGPHALYVSDDHDEVIALDRARGTSMWKQDKLAWRRITGPAVHGPYVAVADYQGYVHFLNQDDGSFAARASTDGSPVADRPISAGEYLVVQTAKGGVYALTVK